MSAPSPASNDDLGSEVRVLQSKIGALTESVNNFVVSSDKRFTTIEQRHDSFTRSITEKGQFSWSILFAAVLALGVVGTLAKQQMDLTVAPVITQNLQSIQDRKELHDEVQQLTSTSTLQAELMTTRIAKETEIETQFSAADQYRNIQFSEQQQKNAELQNCLHDLHAIIPLYPSGPFFQPSISQRQP